MNLPVKSLMRMAPLLLLLSFGVSHAAGDYSDTIALFKNAGPSAAFFAKSYGYAVFPTVGEGGFVVGAALGRGRVYARGRYVGDSTMTQVSAGFQAGGKAFSEIVFFEDARSLADFQSGSFEFGADASVVAITAGANAQAGTVGVSAGASAGEKDARATAPGFEKGMAVFTIAKGGLMYAATVAGEHFSYTPRGS